MSIFDMDRAMTTNVSLPPALEKFARDCVADGRYSNVSEVVRSALRLLREREEARSQFAASIEEAQAEADRDGTFTVEEVLAEVDEIIDSAEKSAAE
jgi:antitoxin ParD1/3/4